LSPPGIIEPAGLILAALGVIAWLRTRTGKPYDFNSVRFALLLLLIAFSLAVILVTRARWWIATLGVIGEVLVLFVCWLYVDSRHPETRKYDR